jgi:hypothetical protein
MNIAGLQMADLLTHVGLHDVLLEYGIGELPIGDYSARIRDAVQDKYNRRVLNNSVKGYGKVYVAPDKQNAGA